MERAHGFWICNFLIYFLSLLFCLLMNTVKWNNSLYSTMSGFFTQQRTSECHTCCCVHAPMSFHVTSISWGRIQNIPPPNMPLWRGSLPWAEGKRKSAGAGKLSCAAWEQDMRFSVRWKTRLSPPLGQLDEVSPHHRGTRAGTRMRLQSGPR